MILITDEQMKELTDVRARLEFINDPGVTNAVLRSSDVTLLMQIIDQNLTEGQVVCMGEYLQFATTRKRGLMRIIEEIVAVQLDLMGNPAGMYNRDDKRFGKRHKLLQELCHIFCGTEEDIQPKDIVNSMIGKILALTVRVDNLEKRVPKDDKPKAKRVTGASSK